MSLHKFAEQVASQGRGDDSLLVHMTPDEVQRLQSFAQANGRSLTINPNTGLPEAGMLSDLFKMVAPIALGAFLGPAGFGMSSMMAGLTTGGITTLATGSLSRGLMAGLGAYGGSGLADSFMNAGANTVGNVAGALGVEGAATGAGSQAAMLAAQNAGFGAEGLSSLANSAGVAAGATPVVPSTSSLLSSGFKAATANPAAMGTFAKQNLANIGMAAAPIMAGMMVPTTTKMPDPKDTGYIRQMAYNINPDTGRPDPLYGMREMTPVKASEWGDKTFQGQRDLFYQQNQNQNPYQLGVGSLNQPPLQQPAQMNTGGIVALAGGGDVPGYATGALVGDADILNYFKTPGLTDAQIAADMQKFQVSAADIARATGTQGQQSDYEKRFVNTLIAPGTDSSEFLKATNAIGLQNQNLTNAMQGAGMSQSAQYAATHNLNDAAGIATAPKAAQDFYNSFGYTAGALPGDQGGLEGLYANINYSAKGLQDQINAGTLTVAQAQNLALGEMDRVGVNQKDIKGATGKDFANLFTPKTVVTPPPDPFVSITPGEVKLPTATTYTNGAFGNYGSGNVTGVDSNGKTVSIATPGDIITNPDGTRTVVPNIPGRPYGGFTGMEGVKSAYTAGGGSLGYTAPVPKIPAEHNATYNKMTDDSLDAYKFLMGKGKNLTQRKAETRDRPVMQRYDEAVLGRKMGKPVVTTAGTGTTIKGTPGNPQSYFNEAEYLAANPDVAAELKTGKSVSGQPVQFTSGYEHYLKYGQGKRAFTGDYQGYTTALALANAANAGGGGDGPTGPSGNTGNTISGFNPAAPNPSIAESFGNAPASTDGNTGSTTGTEGGAVASARGGLQRYAMGGGLGSLGSYSDGGRLLRGPGDGVSDSIPATIGAKQQPARLADGEFVVPARIVSELGNGSTDAGAKKLYAMLDRVQRARGKTTGKNKVAANSRSDKYLPA
jgi:hypothetical protein